MTYKIKSDKLTVSISDIGAEITSVIGADGYEYIWGGDKTYWRKHAPLLFPVCGRLLGGRYIFDGKEYELKTHGFAQDGNFQVEKHSENHIILSLEADENTLKCYPFNFKLTAEYAVNNSELSASFSVENLGNKSMPYMFGWHPGFNLWGDSQIGDFSLEFAGFDNLSWHKLQNGCFVSPTPLDYPLKENRYILSEKEIYQNDTMIFANTGNGARLSCLNCEKNVTIRYSSNLPYFCIWKSPSPEARFICLEPWSDVPNTGDVTEDFNTRKMSRLNEGEKEEYIYNISIE